MIALNNIKLMRGSRVLLDSVNISIQPGEKVGLVGRNGAGKSSLFALFTGQLHEDKGEFSKPAAWVTAQVAQDIPESEDSATNFVLGGDVLLAAAYAALATAETNDDGMAIAHAYQMLDEANAHDARSRAQSLLLGLGFKLAQLEQSVNSFSGGWRMRLQLAAALMCPSDLLLLDEPTNHLDLDALVWLEAWLQRYTGTMIVISHDREFLDAITRVTLHIENGGVTRYGGNYSQFEVLRSQALELQSAAYSKQQERIAHLQKFIDRFKAKASKAKQAQSRVKALERMEKIGPALMAGDFSFEFKEPQIIPNPMLKLRNATLGYENTPILEGITCTVQAGQRIGILGANGQGKSTFVKSVAGTLGVLSGRVIEGKGLKIGYFAQHELDILRVNDNPLEHMMTLSRKLNDGAREQELRNFLGQFLFKNDMVKQAAGTMSGGEKARLVLAMLVWQRPNLLLLDEPTNHLDLDTREALSIALNEFEGTLMLVSHDRSLLREVCDEFWLVSKGGMAPFEGDLDDYQKYLLNLSKEQAAEAKAKNNPAAAAKAAVEKPVAVAPVQTAVAKPAKPVDNKEQRKLEAQLRQQKSDALRPLKRRLEKLEAQIEALGKEKLDIETALITATIPQDIASMGHRLKQIEKDQAYAENNWLEVSESMQALA